MAEKEDNTGKLEVAVRILGNELVALKMVVDDFKMKWLVYGVITIVALGWAASSLVRHCLIWSATMFSKQCKLHLESVNQKPLEHMAVALKTAVKLQLLVPALIIHSIAPRCFTNTATTVMKDILEKRK